MPDASREGAKEEHLLCAFAASRGIVPGLSLQAHSSIELPLHVRLAKRLKRKGFGQPVGRYTRRRGTGWIPGAAPSPLSTGIGSWGRFRRESPPPGHPPLPTTIVYGRGRTMAFRAGAAERSGRGAGNHVDACDGRGTSGISRWSGERMSQGRNHRPGGGAPPGCYRRGRCEALSFSSTARTSSAGRSPRGRDSRKMVESDGRRSPRSSSEMNVRPRPLSVASSCCERFLCILSCRRTLPKACSSPTTTPSYSGPLRSCTMPGM